MKYQIRITKIETVTKVENKWQQRYDEDAFELVRKDVPDAKQFGYEPTEVETTVETEVFRLVKDDLDLKAAVDALNK